MAEKPKNIPESLENIMDWIAQFKNAALVSVGFHVLVAGLIAKDWEQESADLNEITDTQNKVTDFLDKTKQAQEIALALEEERAKKIDHAIELYINSTSHNHTYTFAPISVYLELEAYDQVIFQLEHASPENVGELKDYEEKVQNLSLRWKNIYKEKRDALLEEDRPWTGDPIQDFPILRKLMYEGSNAFFSPDGKTEPNFALHSNSVHEQLESGEVNCKSARFTPWLLEAIYKKNGLPLEPLKNLSAIAWDDHVSTFYKTDGEGIQLQEMNIGNRREVEGRYSPQTLSIGVVDQNQVLAWTLLENYGFSDLEIKDFEKNGYKKGSGNFFKNEIPRTGSLQETQTTESEESITSNSNNRIIPKIEMELEIDWSYFTSGIVETPKALTNEKMRQNLIEIIKHNRRGMLFDLQFKALSTFYPAEAESIIDYYTRTKDLEEKLFKVTFPRTNYGEPLAFDSAIPILLMQRFAKDEARRKAIDTYFLELEQIGQKVLDGSASKTYLEENLSASYRSWAFTEGNRKRWREISNPQSVTTQKQSVFTDIARKIFLDSEVRVEDSNYPKSRPLKEDELIVLPDQGVVDVNYMNYMPRIQSREEMEELFNTALWGEKYENLYVEAQTKHPEWVSEDMIYDWDQYILNKSYESRFQQEPLRHLVVESLNRIKIANNITPEAFLYLGWDKLDPSLVESLTDNFSLTPNIVSTHYPSKSFKSYITETYLASPTLQERRETLHWLLVGHLIPEEKIYPEDLDWIKRRTDQVGLQIRFFYDKDFDPHSFPDEGIEHFLDLTRRASEDASESGNEIVLENIARVWDEMKQRNSR